ncbi:AP2 domain-containing protein [Alkalicoccus luteus]|uniref:AP2 domain-containing protein n=1 Tax=Alkalicoccus luteus TaxID=1237094 RepID=UPI001FEB994E|nr:AP2 domain-containing protein [Alkalicoccus luteus]
MRKRDQGLQQHITTDQVNGTRKSALSAKTSKRNTSGHKGVSWLASRNKWRASIGYQGRQISLGYFNRLDDAVKARKKAEQEYHHPHM